LLSVLLLVPLAVCAQYLMVRPPGAGPYVRFDLGPTFPEDGRLTVFGTFPAGNTVHYETGFASDVAMGYAFNPWVAAELELGWRLFDPHGVSAMPAEKRPTIIIDIPIQEGSHRLIQ
jgi:hypothetical protein